MMATLPDVLDAAPPRVRTFVRKVWRRLTFRNLTGRDNHRQLDRVYALRDPWQMDSEREQRRFVLTNRLIAERVGRVASILEVGCGEGHQSVHLSRLCTHLHGFDVSPRAVARATARVPEGRFDVATLEAVPRTAPGGRYDMVVACEVLYYTKDVAQAVARMSALGRVCLVTFFGPSAHLIAPHVQELPGVEVGWFYAEPYAWLWALWRTP